MTFDEFFCAWCDKRCVEGVWHDGDLVCRDCWREGYVRDQV